MRKRLGREGRTRKSNVMERRTRERKGVGNKLIKYIF